MGNFESLGLVLSAVKDSHCLGLKKTNGTWFIMPPPRGGAGALSSDRVCRPSVCVMVSRNTRLVSFLGLHIGLACEAGLSAGMRRERVSWYRVCLSICLSVRHSMV